jgi:hypothetical protein
MTLGKLTVAIVSAQWDSELGRPMNRSAHVERALRAWGFWTCNVHPKKQ